LFGANCWLFKDNLGFGWAAGEAFNAQFPKEQFCGKYTACCLGFPLTRSIDTYTDELEDEVHYEGRMAGKKHGKCVEFRTRTDCT
jgi:hypothetical protein